MGTAAGECLAASLGERLAALTFVDLATDQVTAGLIEATAAWAADRGRAGHHPHSGADQAAAAGERRHDVRAAPADLVMEVRSS